MRFKTFVDIEVYQIAHELVLQIYKTTKNYPNDEKFGLVAQMRRSAASICANIAEGYKRSSNEFCRYLFIAVGSLEESKYSLILSKDLGYLNKQDFDIIYEKANRVGRMLNGLIVGIQRVN